MQNNNNMILKILTAEQAYQIKELRGWLPGQMKTTYDFVALVPAANAENLSNAIKFLESLPNFKDQDYCGTVLLNDELGPFQTIHPTLYRVFVI